MKNKKIWPAILLIIIMAVAAGIIIYNSTDTARFKKQFDLGHKYLSEMNYEEAVVAFNQAIEIDPRNADAYLGLSDAYIGLGDEEAALVALQAGYEATEDERLKERIDEIMLSRKEVDEDADFAGSETPPEDLETVEEDGLIVLTGTIHETYEYCNPPVGSTYETYCLVLNEEQTVEMEDEAYELSLLGIRGYDETADCEVLLGQEVTVKATTYSFRELAEEYEQMTGDPYYEISPVYLMLEGLVEDSIVN